MVKKYEVFLIFAISTINICFGASIGNAKAALSGLSGKNLWDETKEPLIRRSWVPFGGNRGPLNPLGYYNYGTYQNPAQYKSYSPYQLKSTKKSDLPERGQIKFMKTLLGKVKTLLNDSESKKDSSSEKKALTENQDKISSVTSSGKTGQLYGVLGDSGDSKEKEGEKSVNVISIPLNALTKISKSKEADDDRDSESDTTLDSLENRQRNSQRFHNTLPDQMRSEDDDGREEIPSFENKHHSPFLPVIIANPGERDLGGRMMLMNPITRTLRPLRDEFTSNEFGGDFEPFKRYLPKIPLVLERHGDISEKHSRDDEGLYRDIGHIPGESAGLLHGHSPSREEDVGKTSLRHKNPGRYPHAYHNQEEDKHEPHHDGYDDDDDEDDDDDYDDDDDDDDDDDVNDDRDGNSNHRMQAEAREIASTRNRLLSMLPGNDPTYTSENKGLGIRAEAPRMQMPESFLGNPMLFGMGFNNQRNMLPMNEEAMAGEHADNSNGRDVFMMGGQGTRQVYAGPSSNMEDNQVQMPSFRVNNNGFNLGGSQAQAMSPNEVGYLLQRQGFANSYNELSQKDHISRPKGAHQSTTSANVLIKVNGKPIGDSKELRDHVVNGRVFRGREKLIKSKGPMDVKIARATDGVHSKVVDITSSEKVKVLETKSKIMRNH